MKKILLLIVAFAFFGLFMIEDATANNVRITSAPTLHYRDHPQHGGPGTVYIRFPLRWENSWRSNRPRNWDGVWVFVKAWDGNRWTHVYLHADSTRHHFGRGAGPNHQLVTADCRLGVQMQIENDAIANRMVIEPGRSMVQMLGQSDTEPWVIGVTGVFIHRRGTGRGTVDLRQVNLLWNYAAQGFFDDDELAVKVFALEMVFIPEGAFYLGGAGTERGSFTRNGAIAGFPFRVTSENQIQLANDDNPNTLWVTGATAQRRDPSTGITNIPAAFPKGFRAFWIMKHDLTQEGYAQFLNALNFPQQQAHIGSRTGQALGTNLTATLVGQNPVTNTAWSGGQNIHRQRNFLVQTATEPQRQFGVRGRNTAVNAAGTWHTAVATVPRTNAPVTPPTGAAFAQDIPDTRSIDGQDLAMNNLSWFNVLAFAEWSGLRPMTEMEFEKAARGFAQPVPNEFPWGSILVNASGIGRAGLFWQNDAFTRTAAWMEVTVTHPAFGLAHPLTGDEHFHPQMNMLAVFHGWIRSATGSESGFVTQNHAVRVSAWRVGAFANDSSTRQSSGASYWGVMNMADLTNIMVINATESGAHGFRGSHGTGNLRLSGDPHPRGAGFPGGCVWPVAVGTWFPRGVTMMLSRQVDRGGSTSATASTRTTHNTNQHNASIAELRGNYLSVDINSAMISDRFGSTRVAQAGVNQWNNQMHFIDPSVRLVRTQGWLLPGTPEAAAVGGGGSGS